MAERAVVTGASRGIGREVVAGLVARNVDVVAVGRDVTQLESLRAESPDRIAIKVLDLAQTDALEEEASRLFSDQGLVTRLVNCAGVIDYRRWDAVDLDQLDAHFRVNTLAPWCLCRAFAVALIGQPHHANTPTQRDASIVNVSSTLADRATESTIAYAASKAALNSLTRGLALELAPRGIRVNAVLPGVVNTEMIRVPRPRQGASASPFDQGAIEALAELHPLGRLGTPQEVAEVVIQSLYNTWQTGSMITIDGGLTAR